MKRLCVFAHWDRDNIIDEYVIFYLKALKEVCNYIIFVSDCTLDISETNKLNGIADYAIAQKHGEYDFGSYKRGFNLAKEKELEFEELLFVNDSCYGPFFPLEPIFETMRKKNCDFWGITKNLYGICKKGEEYKTCYSPHIQSYFLAFSKKVFNNSCFQNFINCVKPEKCKNDIIINYEMGLTELIEKNKFKTGVYINSYQHTENCLSIKWDKLIKKKHFPFLKTSIPRSGIYPIGEIKNWKSVIIESKSDYPTVLIEKNATRLRNMQENLFEKMNIYRKLRYLILKNMPLEIRWSVVYIEKQLFLLLNTLCFNKLKKF